MEINYSIEKSVQIIIALLKAYNIRKIIASPGSTNVCLVASLQSDSFFEMYSSVDERSAAYMACGLACESGEPVVLTCTEATASRNYLSGMTEAYYRKLPVLAITATNKRTLIGQNHPQMIDRSQIPYDVAKKSLYLPFISREQDIAGYVNLLNDVFLELFRNGGGPVHIEYETEYSRDYSVKVLPSVRIVKRYTIEDTLPVIPNGKIAIISGAHKRWDERLISVVEKFCEKYNAVFLADHISNYHGKYAVNPTIVTSQSQYSPTCCQIDTVVYIGDISSAYRKNYKIKNVWRVNPDGEIRNVFGNQSVVFQMTEYSFFNYYANIAEENRGTSYYEEWQMEQTVLQDKIPEIPFSNLWCAQNASMKFPTNSVLFLGIENSLRCWNFFDIPLTVDCFCNTGGFGIDGGVSSLIGASLVCPEKLYYGVTGDLAFFYDMNVMGNKHIGKNIRLCVINNGIGQQFKNPGHPAEVLGDTTDVFIAASGHFGNQSRQLLKHYADDLGYEYLSASSKEEYIDVLDRFMDPAIGEKSMILEIFTNSIDETAALQVLTSLEVSASMAAKNVIGKMLGDKGVKVVKSILKK